MKKKKQNLRRNHVYMWRILSGCVLLSLSSRHRMKLKAMQGIILCAMLKSVDFILRRLGSHGWAFSSEAHARSFWWVGKMESRKIRQEIRRTDRPTRRDDEELNEGHGDRNGEEGADLQSTQEVKHLQELVINGMGGLKEKSREDCQVPGEDKSLFLGLWFLTCKKCGQDWG